MTIPEAYATLGLDASSTSPDEARSRFRQLIRSNHPDGRPSHDQAKATEVTRIIVEACIVLRAAGFLSLTTGSRWADSGARCDKRIADEAHSEELHARVDELWRQCVGTHLVWFALPFSCVAFSFNAVTTGWEIMSRNPTRSK